MSSDYKEWKNVLLHEILLNRTRQKPSRDYLSKKVNFFGPINLTSTVQIDELYKSQGLEALSTFDESNSALPNTRLYKNDLVFKRTKSLRGLAGTDLNENNNLVFDLVVAFLCYTRCTLSTPFKEPPNEPGRAPQSKRRNRWSNRRNIVTRSGKRPIPLFMRIKTIVLPNCNTFINDLLHSTKMAEVHIENCVVLFAAPQHVFSTALCWYLAKVYPRRLPPNAEAVAKRY